jgi:hypothetical protein
MMPSTLVRRNLTSYIHGALLCLAELIPTEVQTWAATILDARTPMSTVVEWGGGFCATAEKVYATRTKEEEMVQQFLKRLAERGPRLHIRG